MGRLDRLLRHRGIEDGRLAEQRLRQFSGSGEVRLAVDGPRGRRDIACGSRAQWLVFEPCRSWRARSLVR